ncbi:MAG: tetratricopeptide repeat protein [Myxococcales bacterium]|nr:tetratricopeptide repeat protein [Myxococcales bacterium]
MHRTPRRSLACASLAVALGLAPSLPVLAATHAAVEPETDEASGDPEALSSEAVEKFQAKDYDAAIELFEQAYAVDPQPNYLFNIGRVYEEKGDLQNAVVYYQRFVGQSGVDLESRQAATERLKVLREAVAAMKDDEGDESSAEETKPPEDQGLPPGDQPPGDQPPDDGTAKRKRALRITGYTLLGAGGAGLIVGAVLGGVASGTVDEANGDPYVDRMEAFKRQATRQARAADAMFITGGVLAVAGLALVLSTLGGKKKSGKREAASRRPMWEPVVGPQQVGLGMTHRF